MRPDLVQAREGSLGQRRFKLWALVILFITTKSLPPLPCRSLGPLLLFGMA